MAEVVKSSSRNQHEKGSVENKVGYIRYNFFSTSPVMNSFDELTETLRTQLQNDRQRLHLRRS
ncbi:hypothetical protein [Neobacillus cucumis]|uniref:hypothetical protein n=1 Tax=Neobacillus cucumis TaxID=1740721 RepID=UPI00285363A8|nr:hypothetical protein [Neobacillus cucumis]MDR4949898.1 hypothetical protein [Neobacillus cucumis]